MPIALVLPSAGTAKLLPEAETLTECLRLADWTLQAGQALRAGVAMNQHLGADELPAPAGSDERRAAVEAVYRDRPADLSDYIAVRLGRCLRGRGTNASDRFAKACYDQTLWAATLFAYKRQGVALERVLSGPMPALAEAVYRSEQPEAEFRRDLLLECLN